MTNNQRIPLDLPADTSLPFFAYGIFKPKQLAYSKIKNHVDEEKLINTEIPYEMRIRDGVPILTDKQWNGCTKGFIITFRQGHDDMAYDVISKTLLKKLYEWKTVVIDGQTVNVLFGVDPDKGSNYIEDPNERVNFDGKNDPFFSEVIESIERNLDSNKFSRDMMPFFELQMNYMMLWSAIERYSSLKYNKSKSVNNEKFANQKSFKDSIKKFEDKPHSSIYSTEDLKIHEFDAEDPKNTMYYYYTFRCNVVHKGKSMPSDYDMLKQATEELLEIFKDVLNDTFGKYL